MANYGGGIAGWLAGLPEHHHAHQQEVADEERRNKFADLDQTRQAIRDKMSMLPEGDINSEPLKRQLDDVQFRINQVYHPIHAPGALQRDWQWLAGHLTRRNQKEKPISSEIPESTAADQSITPGAQPVKLPATEAYKAVTQSPSSGVTYEAGPMAGKPVPGMVKRGNIDVNHRVQVKNADGSGSSIFSVTVPLDKSGKAIPWEVSGQPNPAIANYALVPGMDVNGRFFTPDGKEPKGGSYKGTDGEEQAAAYYNQTGQHLGTFTTADAANQYAGQTHAWTNDGTDRKIFTPSYSGNKNQGKTGKAVSTESQKLSPQTEAGTPEQDIAIDPKDIPGAAISVPGTKTPAIRPTPESLTPYQRKIQKAKDQAKDEASVYAAGGAPNPVDVGMKLFDRYVPNASPQQREEHMLLLVEAASGMKLTGANTKWVYKVGTMPDGSRATVKYNEKDPRGGLLLLNNDPVPPDFKLDTGKGMSGFSFDKVTGQVKGPDGQRYNEGDPQNPPEAQEMFTGFHRQEKAMQDYMIRLATMRGEAYNASRFLNLIDTQNGNRPVTIQGKEYLKDPGRYLPQAGSDKALQQVNLFEDLARVSRSVREAVGNLKEDFPAETRARIALALTTDDHGALFTALQSELAGTLSIEQWQFLVASRQLAENAMAMRSVLGAGGQAEDVRTAIQATLPNLLMPNRQFGLIQLDAFDKTLEQLHGGVRNVPLNTQNWSVQTGKGQGRTRSVKGAVAAWNDPKWQAKAMQKWGHFPPTEAEVIKDLTDNNFTPRP